MSQFFKDSTGVEHEFPDDATPEEMAAAIEGGSAVAPGGPGVTNEGTQRMAAGQQAAMRTLPTIFGLASLAVPQLRLARFAGPATAAARTAVGAAGGYLGGMASGQNPNRTAMEQGSATLMGEAGAGMLTRGARGLMGSALRPTASLQRGFPKLDFAGEALKEGVPVGSQAGKEGSKELGVRVLKSSSRLTQRLKAADAAGYRKTAADVSGVALKKLEKELGRAPTSKERKDLIVAIRDEANQLLADRRFGIAPAGKKTTFNATELKQIKQAAQQKARTIIKAEQAGNNPGVKPDLARSVSRGALASMPRSAQKVEGETQRLIGLQKAFESAEMRNPLPPQMQTLRGSLMRPLETPQFQSRAALALDSPLARLLALGGPRSLALGYDMMQDDETP